MDFIIELLLVFWLPLLVIAKLLYNHCRSCQIKNRIQYCLTLKPDDIISYILSSYKDYDNISFDYKTESPYFTDIILSFQNHISNLFWTDELSSDKEILKLSSNEYLLFYLFHFLNNNNIKSSFNGHVMYTQISSSDADRYGDYEELCAFTDFGITYCKLFYMVALICENNHEIQKLINHPVSEELKQKLTRGTLTLYHTNNYSWLY